MRNISQVSNARHDDLPIYCKETWRVFCQKCAVSTEGVCIREGGDPKTSAYLFKHRPEKVFAEFIQHHAASGGCHPVYSIIGQAHVTPEAVIQ